ncbi:MAG: DUF3883 domain-containing protein [Alphaproteobacteria bacterium]
MVDGNPSGTPWSASEIDLIVADYFGMLWKELAGEPYIKSQRNTELQRLTGRSKGSIEYKHQNISAVLEQLGRPWILGYKPAVNFQKTLIDGIERYLASRGQEMETRLNSSLAEVTDSSTLYFEPPPILNESETPTNEDIKRLVRKFNPAERDVRNRELGEQGERKVLDSERARLNAAGREDLARKVEWTSKERGDGAGYDILSFASSGQERLLEVKTTTGPKKTPFYLTENERSLSAERPDSFRIVRLYDFVREPKAFKISPPLESSVILSATNYRASFGT